MSKLTRDELNELLRYFIGNPPYVTDNRYRDLVSRYSAEDDRPLSDEVRFNQDYHNSLAEEAAEDQPDKPVESRNAFTEKKQTK